MKKAWEVAKKYKYLVTYPLGAVTIITMAMINDVNYRNRMEKEYPDFVDLVRKRYGFSEENEDERKLSKLLEKHFTTPVTITIKQEGGVTKVIKDVSPHTLITDVLKTNHIHSIDQHTLYCSNLMNFEDSTEIPIESNLVYLQVPGQKKKDEKDHHVVPDDDSSLLMKKPSMYTKDFTWKQNSLWTNTNSTNNTKNLFASFSQYTSLYYQRFDNYIDHILMGYVQYSDISDFPRISQVWYIYELLDSHDRI